MSTTVTASTLIAQLRAEIGQHSVLNIDAEGLAVLQKRLRSAEELARHAEEDNCVLERRNMELARQMEKARQALEAKR